MNTNEHVAHEATIVADLATQLGVPVTEAQWFVDCLAVFVAKGLTVEQAIAAHLHTLHSLANNVADALTNEHSRHTASVNALKAQAVEWFYEGRVSA